MEPTKACSPVLAGRAAGRYKRQLPRACRGFSFLSVSGIAELRAHLARRRTVFITTDHRVAVTASLLDSAWKAWHLSFTATTDPVRRTAPAATARRRSCPGDVARAEALTFCSRVYYVRVLPLLQTGCAASPATRSLDASRVLGTGAVPLRSGTQPCFPRADSQLCPIPQ